MGVNGCKKGKTFERDIAKRLKEEFDDEFKRTPSSGALVGGQNKAKTANLRADAKEILTSDIISPEWFKFGIECKSYKEEPKFHHMLKGESKKFDEWIRQVEYDCESIGKLPLIIFKINRMGTYAAFKVDCKDIVYSGESFLLYKGYVIMTLDAVLSSLGDSYYYYKKE